MTRTFRELGVAPELCDELEKQGITHPFPIQEMTLPLALAGNDLIGQARTGTGKTLAFGLPLLQRLDPDLRRTQALIVVPTRELCVQVHSDLRIGKALGISSVSVYGGVPYEEQTELLTSGAHVVVGTPGRLLDHLNRGILDLSQVSQLVLDEADEMLDMGFLPDVERLIESCSREGRHTMLFSATMPTEIVRLGRRYLDHPTFTRAASQEADTAPTVEQHFFQVHRMDKPRVLARILQSPKRKGVFVFVRTKHMADRLVDELEGLGTPAIAIHGDLRQTTRERNLDRFRSGKANVLVATEVAARGLDVTDVTHVINYDCPDDEKMYLHRIGRTARAGQDGAAITFAEHNEISRLDVIRKAVGSDEAVVDVFSTSDELTRRFDLPEETPWGHFVATARAGGRQGSPSSRGGSSKDASRTRGGSSKDASEARPTRSRDDDTSTSNGSSDRPRGGSSRRGRGASAKDASTRGDRGRSGDRTTRDTSEAGSPPADVEKDASNEQVRTRTRTRARATTPRESTRDTAPSRDGDGGGRTRAGRDDRQGEAGRERDASERQSSRTRGGSRRGSSSNRGQESRSDEDQGTTSGGGRRRGSSGGRGDDGGNSRGDNGGGGRSSGSRNGSSSRGSSGGGRGGSRGGNGDTERRREGSERGSRGSESSGDRQQARRRADAAPRGSDARGDGHPQPTRRVRVEHLP